MALKAFRNKLFPRRSNNNATGQPLIDTPDIPATNAEDPIENFYSLYKPESLATSINLCCERVENMVNRFSSYNTSIQTLEEMLEPRLEDLKRTFYKLPPLWNASRRETAWSSRVQANLIVALLTLQYFISDFEHDVLRLIFVRFNSQGNNMNNMPDDQKLEKLRKYIKDLGTWCDVVDKLLSNPGQSAIDDESFKNPMNENFSAFFQMNYVVHSDIAQFVDARQKSYNYGEDPDYRQIKYQLKDLPDWAPPRSSDGSVPVTDLIVKTALHRYNRSPKSSISSASSASSKTSEVSRVPVFVHRIEITRTSNSHDRSLQEVRKLVVLLSQTNYSSRFPQFYGCVEVPDSSEVDSKTGEQRHPHQIYLLSDATDRDNLQTLIEDNESSPPSPRHRLRIVAGVAEAIFFLHESRIFHKDIQPLNIIIRRSSNEEDDWQPRLTGFTRTRQLGMVSVNPNYVDLSTIYWEPPSRLGGGRSRWSAEDDVYQLGLLMCDVAMWKRMLEDPMAENITEKRPDKFSETLNNVKTKFASQTEKYMGPEYRELVESCIDVDANNRRGAFETWQALLKLSNTVTDTK